MRKIDEIVKIYEELTENKITQEIHELFQRAIKEAENAKMNTSRLTEFYYAMERYFVLRAGEKKALN